MNKATLCLCSGRHEMPDEVQGSVFGNELNPMDLAGMYDTAANVLEGVDSLDLYVTGLTVALGEVIKVCVDKQINLTLYHFDREAKNYYSQAMLRWNHCPFCGERFLGVAYHCPNCGAS